MTTIGKYILSLAYSTGLTVGIVIVIIGLLIDDALPTMRPDVRTALSIALWLLTSVPAWRIMLTAYRRARLGEADYLEAVVPHDESDAYKRGWVDCARAGRARTH